MLEKHCKSACSKDIAFAKKKVVSKRNRYNYNFPCELRIIILSNYIFVIVRVHVTLCHRVTCAAVVHA